MREGFCICDGQKPESILKLSPWPLKPKRWLCPWPKWTECTAKNGILCEDQPLPMCTKLGQVQLGQVQLGNNSPLLSQSQLVRRRYLFPGSPKGTMFPNTPWLLHELGTCWFPHFGEEPVKAHCCCSGTKSLPLRAPQQDSIKLVVFFYSRYLDNREWSWGKGFLLSY